MEIRTIVIIGIMALMTAPVQADLYKWIDETGATVYSESPPPAGVQVLTAPTIQAPPTDGTTAPQTPEYIGEAAAKLSAEAEARRVEQKIRVSEEERLRHNREACERMRANLEVLKLQRRVFYYDERGEKQIMSTEDRDQKAAETEQKIREYCQE